MDFKDVIISRESVRNYDPEKEIPEEVLMRILEAGRIAPSATNSQPWQFVVVRSPEKRKEVNKCYGKAWFQNAPVVLIVKGKRKDAWNRWDGYNSLETDLTIAMDHMILAAENEGLGTCWIGAFDYEVLRKVLPLDADEEVFAMTPLGYQEDGWKKKNRKIRRELNDVVRFI
ncbi:MAG: nitroreductase family protein [Spirochaetia bacterium]|nr:nitroreductase family protein [Spirochaetia bacterium]